MDDIQARNRAADLIACVTYATKTRSPADALKFVADFMDNDPVAVRQLVEWREKHEAVKPKLTVDKARCVTFEPGSENSWIPAYTRGVDAQLSGYKRHNNPYPYGSLGRTAWDQGFDR